MAIMRWTPFSAFLSIEKEMQDVFDRLTMRPRWDEGFEWKPATDVFKEGGDLVVRAEIPGIEAEDLNVVVEDGMLQISGEKTIEKEIEEADRYMKQCRYGSFRRDLMLPEGVTVEDIEATFDNGVLTVRVPLPDVMVEEPQAVKVEVKTGSPSPVPIEDKDAA